MKILLPPGFDKDGTKTFMKGITVKELRAVIEALPTSLQDAPVLVSSDEEQNQVFKGLYIQVFSNGVLFAGLSGTEVDDE